MSQSKPSSASAKVPVAGVRIPNLLDYFNAIADSSLSGSEKALCFAILRYRNQTSGECFPSMHTLATTASMGVRAAQKAMRRLASCGVVIYVRRSLGGLRASRGIPHTLRLDLDALRSMGLSAAASPTPADRGPAHHATLEIVDVAPVNHEPRAGFNPEPDDGQPRTYGRFTPNHATRNREPRAHKPSIEPSKEPTIEPSAVHASAARWMDAPTPPASRPEPARVEPTRVEPARPEPARPEPARPEPARPEPARPEPARPEPARPEPARPEPARPEPARIEPARLAAYQALQAAGVRGPNLLSLARSPAITAELVRAENVRLRADPTVTHPPGALVKVLAQHAGITLRGRTRPVFVAPVAPKLEPLSAASLAHVRSIEQMRAMRGTSTCGTAIGDVLPRHAIDGPPCCDTQRRAEPVEFVRNGP